MLRAMNWSVFGTCVATCAIAFGCGGNGRTGGGGATSSVTNGGAGGASTTSSSAGGSATTSSSATGGAGGATTQTAPTPIGCVTDVSAGHHVFACEGVDYDVEIPADCAGGGCGLVLDMHGYTMNASQEDAGTGMRALGQKHGYVIVQPTAPLVTGWVQATHAPAVFAFISDARAALVTDPRRSHVMGFSQGGGMTWRMICSHADFFASAAPLSGLPGCEWALPNAPTREVPILQVHGHLDTILNYAAYAIPERDAVLAFWSFDEGSLIQADGKHKATRYVTPSGTVFEHWEHDYFAANAIYSGHCFPGGSDVGISLTQFGCTEPNSFVVGEVAMTFFIDHPMP